MKKIVIHQPNTFPRLKVLQKIAHGDLWIILDDVQFVRRECQNRAKIRFLNNPTKEFWITIPISKTLYRQTKIKSIEIVNYDSFAENLCKKIWFAYRRSFYWNYIDSYINDVINISYKDFLLSTFNINSAIKLFELLSLNVEILFSSSFENNSFSNMKLINLCKKTNSNIYISGTGSKNYILKKLFTENNIKILWQNWNEETLSAKYDNLSWRNISSIDFLARYGPKELKKVLLDINTVL